ncbi:MAG: ATPase domain-containing protein [Desulfobacterales bacterium]
MIEGWIDPHVFLSGDFSLKGLLAIIEGKAEQMGARRIVIDAVDMLMRVFDTLKQQENEIFALHRWLKDKGMTAVVTTKKGTGLPPSHEYLDFMADCVIHLDQRVREQVNTKRLQVIKYRGSGYGGNEFPFLISGDGLYFDPISDVEMYYKPLLDRISSGNPSLDKIIGGGYQKGTCILISGLTGTGKTSMGCTFACSASREGDKVLYVTYEESRDGIAAGMLSLGIDLRPGIEEGVLEIMAVMPESMGVEEHLFVIKRAIRRFKPQHLVVDAISALKRIAGEAAAFDFLIRIVDVCKKNGLTVILINQARGSSEDHEFSGIGISSVIDTVITLHRRDMGNEVSRVLLVRKSRGSNHSNKYHDFSLTDRGIQIE